VLPGAPEAAILVPIRKKAATAFRPYSGLDWANRSKRFDNRLSISHRLPPARCASFRTSAAPPTNSPPKSRQQRLEHFRETMAMSKSYVEARAMHGQSELLDEIVAATSFSPSPTRSRPHAGRKASR
jgi:hypothetical protein